MKKLLLLVYFSIFSILVSGNNLRENPDTRKSVLLLIDVSGSMMGVKIDSVKSAAKQIIRMLLPCNTEFSVMGFSGQKDNPVPFQLDFTENEFDLLTFIDKLKPEGGTLLGTALKKASFGFSNHAATNKLSKKTIILLSDGRSDDNIPNALREIREKDALIQCECIGYDIEKDAFAQEQLRLIAQETGGEYYAATDVNNIIKAFLKTSIKTIIHDTPVVVRSKKNPPWFALSPGNIYKQLTTRNWILDSIQINVSSVLYDITREVADENMQDTLPKSLVFDNGKNISLYINKGSESNSHKKWLEGNYSFANNALSITIQHYYFRLIIKSINEESLVLCVNRFRNYSDGTGENNEQVCDCGEKMNELNPYIYIYFSQAGCNH